MRYVYGMSVVLAVVSIAGCGDQQAVDVLSPPAATELHGSFTTLTSSEVVPPTLTITGAAEGTATELGRFTAASVDVVDLATTASTGTFNFTAENGDLLFTTTAGAEDEFIPPNVSRVTLVATIVGGTGRFAAATGTFTMQLTHVIDFATGTASGSGSFDGTISLGN